MRPRDEITKELAFYAKCNLPPEALYEWAKSLPDDERQVVLDEIRSVIEKVQVVWESAGMTDE